MTQCRCRLSLYKRGRRLSCWLNLWKSSGDSGDAEQRMSWPSYEDLQVLLRWPKLTLTGACKAQMVSHAWVWKGNLCVWSELWTPLVFHLYYSHEEVWLVFVADAVWVAQQRGRQTVGWATSPPAPHFVLQRAPWHFRCFCNSKTSSSWVENLGMESTEEIESWVVFYCVTSCKYALGKGK